MHDNNDTFAQDLTNSTTPRHQKLTSTAETTPVMPPNEESKVMNNGTTPADILRQNTILKKGAKRSKKVGNKTQTISFEDLSAELRSAIYELALTETTNDVSIVSVTIASRRTAGRACPTSASGIITSKSQTRIVPNLLSVSKQVYAEGINVLYGQKLVFQDTVALYQFLANIGPRNVVRLHHVELSRWDGTGRLAALRHAAFTRLAGATGLQSLKIELMPAHSGLAATQLFRKGHFFFEAYGAAHGRKDAGVIMLDPISGKHKQKDLPGRVAKMEKFRATVCKELGEVLCAV